MDAGQQEGKFESLESIHAARLRSGSEAGTSAPQLGQTAAAVPAKSQLAPGDEAEDGADISHDGAGEPDVESDPYSLPVSHEVALEGMHHHLSTVSGAHDCTCMCAMMYQPSLACSTLACMTTILSPLP